MGEMIPGTLYDEDIVRWSEEQGRVLRSLAKMRRDLPNDLDIENVAEEIESVGRSETAAVESLLRLLMLHLVKVAIDPDAQAVGHWREEALNFHADAVSRFAPSMAQRLDLQRAWRLARRQALVAAGGAETPPVLPQECPFAIAELVAEAIDLDVLLKQLRASKDPPEEGLVALARRLFGENGVDLELPPRQAPREPPDFSE